MGEAEIAQRGRGARQRDSVLIFKEARGGEKAIIAGLWVLGIGLGIHAGTQPMQFAFGPNPPRETVVLVLGLPVVFFPAASFLMPYSPFYSPRFARLVDDRLGAGAFAAFLVRLKPLLLLGVAAIAQSLAALSVLRNGEATPGTYLVHGFFISGGIGFALAHVLLYYRKVPGVYPASEVAAASPAQSVEVRRMSLGEALRAYWWSMLGLIAFPTVALIGMNVFHVPFGYLVPLFLAATLLAGWPYGSGRAPYSFWVLACVVYVFGGTALAILISGAFRFLSR